MSGHTNYPWRHITLKRLKVFQAHLVQATSDKKYLISYKP